MADYQRGAHADVEPVGTLEFACYQLACGVADGFQAFDEEHRDARNEFHHRAHLDAQAEDVGDFVDNFIPGAAGEASDAHADYNTEKQRLAEHAEFAFQSLGVDFQTVHAGNLVETLVYGPCKGHKTCAERLWNRDSVHAVVESLEFLGRDIGQDKRDDIADYGTEESPRERVAGEVDYGADEGEVPVVPEVDVDGARGLGEEHQKVDAQTHGDDERAHGSVVGHRGGCGPSHVEHLEL